MINVPQFNAGDILTANNMTILAEAVIELQTSVFNGPDSGSNSPSSSGSTVPPAPDIFSSVFPAKMTAIKQWQEETAIGTAIVDYTDGRTCTSDSDPSVSLKLTTSEGVQVEIRDGENYRYVWLPNSCFFVDLVQVGGSAGDGSTESSFTYDVKLHGTSITIGSALLPVKTLSQIFMCEAIAATTGLAQWNGSTLILVLAFDAASQNTCDDDSGGGSSPSFMGV